MRAGGTAALAFAHLGVGLALCLVAQGCINEDLLNPMADRQPRARAYKQSAFFDDGLSMRAPPKHTVPRERILGNSALTTGKVGEAFVTTIPVPLTRKLLDLGRKRYDITCGTCHGPIGDGDSIVAKNMSLRPPPSLHLYRDRPAGYLYEVIVKGFGLMGSYAAELTVEERWAVVAYTRVLQLSQNVAIDRAPADVRSRLEQQQEAP
jgi:hypothetical protein